MTNHLIIVLDDSSPSYCHYENLATSRLISLSDLKAGILYAMKENLSIQFILPDYMLPQEYWETMNEIDSTIYVSSTCEDSFAADNANVIILNNWSSPANYHFSNDKIYVLRTSRKDFYDRVNSLKDMAEKADRLNVIITNPEGFSESEIVKYEKTLDKLSQIILEEFQKGHSIQVNLLTDRILLDKMNNCNAGVENITLMPDGKFYACPAFYYDKERPIGSLRNGINIVNPQLYMLAYAPICSVCDAYHCKRCAWLNHKLTHEKNTPSKEQCLMAHIERKASRKLLADIRKHGMIVQGGEIPELDYMDPLEKLLSK